MFKKITFLIITAFWGLEIFSQTTLLSEDFESYANTTLSGASAGWKNTTTGITQGGSNNASPNKWYMWDNSSSGCPITGSRSLMIGTNGGTMCSYNNSKNTDVIAYYNGGINVSSYGFTNLSFSAKCVGESGWDYVSIVYAFSASAVTVPTTWTYGGSVPYNVTTATTYSLNVCPSNTYLWVGFEWVNDGSGGSAPAAVIDNVVVTSYSGPDACANATNLSFATINNGLANTVTYSASVIGSNRCASADVLNSGCFNANKNVWYTFTPPVSGSYYVGVQGGTMSYPEVSVLSGSCASFTTELGCAGGIWPTAYGSKQPYGYFSSTYSYAGGCNLVAGTTYYVMVDNNPTTGGSGTYTLNIVSLSNDQIPTAAIIANCGTSFGSSTIGATNCGNCLGSGVYNDLDCNSSTSVGSGSGSDVYTGMSVENDSWYQFCTTTAGTYSVTMTPVSSSCIGPNTGTSTQQLQMNLYTGTSTALNWINGNYTGNNTGLTFTVSLAANGCAFIEVDGYSGTNCDYNLTLSGACTLPVELAKFTGDNINNKKIKLNWTTLSETNSSYFIMERSNNAKDYSRIGKTMANNNSTVKTDYTFFDENPLDGLNYYRLVLVNNNGKEEVIGNTMVTNKSHLPNFSIFPNPSNGKLNVNLSNFSSPAIEVEIFDMYGRIVWSSAVELKDGNSLQEIDLTSFGNGVYFVKATDGTTVYKQSLVISKNN